MSRILSKQNSANILLVLFSLLILMHLLIILQVIPYEFVWGGQLQDAKSMLGFEIFAIFLLVLFMLLVCLKVGYIQTVKGKFLIQIGLWLMFIYFLLNILGNLISQSGLEKLIFTPVSIIIAFLSFILIRMKN